MFNISIVGQIGSGKSSLAEHFEKKGYTRVAFASILKRMLDRLSRRHKIEDIIKEEINGYYPLTKGSEDLKIMTEIMIEAKLLPDEKPKPRKRLQYIGNTAREKIDNNIWVDIFLKSLDPDKKYVCEDTRYLNEFNALHKAGWKTIKLIVSPEVKEERIKRLYGTYDKEVIEHPSETGFNEISDNKCILIDADAELNDMFKEVDRKLGLR